MIVPTEKRWQRRRELWVTPVDRFDPRQYAVDVLDGDATAKRFVCEHHYSASFPAARLSVGLFGPQAQLVGVATFSVPMNQRVIPKYTGDGNGAELGRFVCLPSVRFNGESWFLARAFRFVLQEKMVCGVVSYADPLERRTVSGELYKRQHWGTIYQASNATYVGRSCARTLLVAGSGEIVSPRSLSKIRNRERGWEYATRQLVERGAPPRENGEDPRGWVRRAETTFRRVRHDGNLVYVFGLTRAATTRIRAIHGPGLDYPKARAA
jgi:hypothetical protein